MLLNIYSDGKAWQSSFIVAKTAERIVKNPYLTRHVRLSCIFVILLIWCQKTRRNSRTWTTCCLKERRLVFICRENHDLDFTAFLDRPRLFRLMKTGNRWHPQSSGMVGDKSGKSGAFLFSQRVTDFCDGRRLFPTVENSNLYCPIVGDSFSSLPIL